MKFLLTGLIVSILTISSYSQSITRLTNFDPEGFEAISPTMAHIYSGVDGNVFFTPNSNIDRDLYSSNGTTEGTVKVPSILFYDDRITEIKYTEDYIYISITFEHFEYYIYRLSREDNTIVETSGNPEGAYSLTVINNELFFIDQNSKLFQFPENEPMLINDEKDKAMELVSFQDNLYIIYETRVNNSITNYTLAKHQPQSNTFEIIHTTTDGDYKHSFLKVVDDYLVYGLGKQNSSYRVWKLNGTTNEIKEISYSFERGLNRSMGALGFYFDSRPSYVNSKLYVYDIITEEETIVRIGDPTYYSVSNRRNTQDGKIYYISRSYDSSDTARYMYESDLTIEGTKRISQFKESSNNKNIICTHKGELFHTLVNETSGKELWKTQPSDYENQLIKDIFEGQESSDPFGLFSSGDNLFFFAKTEELGYQLYVYNGKPVSTNAPSSGDNIANVGPNPVNNTLRINLTNTPLTSIKVSISNSIGESVVTKELNKALINTFELGVENLSAGVSFMQLDYNNKKELHKIIKL